MLDGRLTRLAILCLLLLAPLASAAPPTPRAASADLADGQDITDMAADPSGQFVMSVVAFDTTKTSTGLPLSGASEAHDDLYRCDYGPLTAPTSGSGCRGLRHPSNIVNPLLQTPNAPQRVAAGVVTENGIQGVFAVVGPDQYVSRWTTTSDSPTWTKETLNGHDAVNVTMARDGSRIVVGTVPPSPGAEGRIEVRWGHNGTVDWFYGLKNAADANVRPTSLDYSRTNGIVAIGTTDTVLFVDPTAPKPDGKLGSLAQADAVSDVELSVDGRFVVVGASNGIFLAELERSQGKIVPRPNSVFNNNFGTSAQAVAISLDGGRFAAAAGQNIYLYRRLDTAAVAEPVGTAYNTGARVADMAYDEKGRVLVALSGNNVIGFGPNKATPIWSFDATTSAFGSLDGPLRKVSISDDGQRIVVAGKTRTIAYNMHVGVAASIASTSGATTMQPTQTMTLALTAQNTGSQSDNYTFSVVAPVGWTADAAPGMKLDPEGSGTSRFNVTAPAGTAPGVYGVQVRVRSQAHEDIAAGRGVAASPTYLTTPSFNITIPRSVVLKVEAPDDTVLLRQGGEQTVPVVLRNEGNADGIVNLSVTQELTRGASWDVRYQPGDQVTVPASGTATVNVLVRAPDDAGSGDRNIITLRAREGTTVEATDQITAYVDAQFGAELKTNQTSWEFYPGQVQTVMLNVTNIGNTEDVYNLTSSITPATIQSDWRVTIETPQVTVQRGETKRIAVTVKAVATDAREASLNLVAESQNAPDRDESRLVLNLMTIPRPPTDDDDRFLPAPGVGLVAVAIVAVAIALRSARGGRE